MQIVNKSGLEEIRRFLAENHKLGGGHFTDSMLSAWASDAEFQSAEGNSPSIEVRAADSVSGHTVTYTISASGMDEVALDGEEISKPMLGSLPVGFHQSRMNDTKTN